jgi:hypothetical protein
MAATSSLATPSMSSSVPHEASMQGTKRKAEAVDELISSHGSSSESKLERNNGSKRFTMSKESIAPTKESYTSNKEVVHNGISCDECEMESIIGNRFKCSKCPNYDLCETCHSKNVHAMDHIFIRVASAPPRSNQLKTKNDKILISFLHQHPLILHEITSSSLSLSCKAIEARSLHI